ncbi:SUKH-4 family immunity protein [Streptomyces sp. NPDC087917]|uniref:SUKH-4 family immunity protein n=1 Tax=Streptomyces sp. NPDC087917 TaxID=3155060 RepID=UPI0034195F7E
MSYDDLEIASVDESARAPDFPFSSPAALLDSARIELRTAHGAAGGVGREVFTQAEAVFGQEEVSRAEFASWLHFAARVLGRDAYAERVEAAEPALPWRTVWAWWRPVGAHRGEPNLSGDRNVEVFAPLGDPERSSLLKVSSLWEGERWFRLDTGAPCAEPDAGTYEEWHEEDGPEGPVLFGTEERDWALHCPGTWEEPVALGGGRFLIAEARGVLVAERNPAVAHGARSGGGARYDSWEEGGGDPWFVDPAPAERPLSAARLDAVFGAARVLRVPPELLPATLTHRPTRELLSAVGLPRLWAAGVASFEAAGDGSGPPVHSGGGAAGVAGSLHLGTFDLGYADTGLVLLRPDTGALLMVRNGGEPFPLARDTETFVRLLEAVRRHMGSCWDPYPAEDGVGHFHDEVEALEPAALGPDGPTEELWGHVFASITELGVWGY